MSLTLQAQDESELAKATQNPVADMISLPFQNNTTYGNAPYNRAQNILNIQPVIPIQLGDISENKFLFQYFVNYNLSKGWYVVSAPIMTANWNAPECCQA